MTTDSFRYSDQQWRVIKKAVSAFDVKAEQKTPEQRDLDGHPITVTLRSELEGAASTHLARSKALRMLPTPLKLTHFLTKKCKAVENLRRDLIASHVLRFNVGTHKANPRLEYDMDRVLSRIASQLAGQIAAIGTPRQQSTKNAAKRIRNLFWDDVLEIWSEIGGKETGVHAADFLMAVSRPVYTYARMRAGAKDPVPERNSVQQWLLRRRAKART